MGQERILVIVPAFNESGNIKRTVDEIRQLTISVSILVVDDGSIDATAKEAKAAGVRVVSLPFNLGIGGAVQTGFQYARQNDFDLAVQVDGDGQHDLAYFKELIEPILSHRADMVIGSRFIPPFLSYRSSLVRRMGINFFAWLIGILTGVRITDSTSGFRAFNKKMIKSFARNYPYDFPEPEAIVMAKRSGARILEVPVKMRKRETGVSSIRYLKTLYYMVKVTCAILLDMIRAKERLE